ncbi:hypothetical protein F5Y06DRAFT_264627 [Hypoxylon sp. FL0890]|nr:hypothetical protein F5Y06DRAFT_264627 [Hypoxylon sp. FL0890]
MKYLFLGRSSPSIVGLQEGSHVVRHNGDVHRKAANLVPSISGPLLRPSPDIAICTGSAPIGWANCRCHAMPCGRTCLDRHSHSCSCSLPRPGTQIMRKHGWRYTRKTSCIPRGPGTYDVI